MRHGKIFCVVLYSLLYGFNRRVPYEEWPGVYRLLQVLLLVSVIAALVIRSDSAVFLPAAVCVVNLVLYMLVKMKYELELSLSGPAVQLLEIGRKLAARKEVAELYPELESRIKSFSGGHQTVKTPSDPENECDFRRPAGNPLRLCAGDHALADHHL